MSVFGSYANFYDLLYRDKDYPAEVDFIEALFKKYANGTVKTVLDMGCGTGGHALLLAERGYSVTGVDRSEAMLSIAEEKAMKINGSAEFSQADIRDFDLNKKFDAVISMFAVMGYQNTNEDFEGALLSAGKHLRPGGLFIFDVWFGPAVLTEKPSDKVLEIENGDEKVIRTTKARLRFMEHIVEVQFHIMRIKGNTIGEQTEETHNMRFFFPKEIEYLLENNHLEMVDIIPFLYQEDEIDLSTWNVSIIARKTSKS